MIVAQWRHVVTQICVNIVNSDALEQISMEFYLNFKYFIQENVFEHVVCEMVAILSRGRWVDSLQAISDSIWRHWSWSSLAKGPCETIISGIIVYTLPANETRGYIVTSSLIGPLSSGTNLDPNTAILIQGNRFEISSVKWPPFFSGSICKQTDFFFFLTRTGNIFQSIFSMCFLCWPTSFFSPIVHLSIINTASRHR